MIHPTRNVATFVAIGCVLFALGGCAAGQTAPDAGGEDAAAQAQSQAGRDFDGGSVSWDGKELAITVETDASNGYQWEASLMGDGLKYVGSEAGDGSGQDEGPSTTDTTTFETLTFTGVAKGTSTVTLEYRRAHETTDEDKVVTVEVVTDDSGAIQTAEVAELSGAEAAAAVTDANTQGDTITSSGAEGQGLQDAGSGTDVDVTATTDNAAPKDAAAQDSVAETIG